MKSELFIECAKNVVDFYNATQEAIGSKNRMEYPKVTKKEPDEFWIPKYMLIKNGLTYKPPYYPEEYIKVREVIE